MKIPNQEMEEGLLVLFKQMAQYTSEILKSSVANKKGSPARNNFSVIGARSLFVKWESLWDSFELPRKTAWINYWITLPFGDHSGAGGWPGSGYSAFIYVNAPRYQAGQDLLLDPPVIDLIYNGTFNLGFNGWEVYDFTLDNGVAISENPSEGGYIYLQEEYRFTIPAETILQLSCDIVVVGGSVTIGIYSYDLESWIYETYLSDYSGHFTANIDFEEEMTNLTIQIYCDPTASVEIDNISLK